MRHFVEFNISEYPELSKKIDGIPDLFTGDLIPKSTGAPIEDWHEVAGNMWICVDGSISEFLMIFGDILEGRFEFVEESNANL